MLFDSFSANTSGLDRHGFEKICPAIVQQIESKACSEEESDSKEEVKEKNDKAQAWGYGFLAVTIISCASLCGAFVVPFMNKDIYKILLLFMVSLSVGVLCGSGIFHLIPHAYALGKLKDPSNRWKSLTVVGGIYLFFMLEYVMKMFIRYKEGGYGKTENTVQVSDKNVIPGNEKNAIQGNEIAQVQLQLYNAHPEDHSHAHVNQYFPTDEPDEKASHTGQDCGGTANMNSGTEVAVTNPGDLVKPKKNIKPVAWMIIIGDGLHNFIDGLAIGVSFSTSNYVGLSTSLAIFCEELPHELGDFAVLLNAGMGYRTAMFFNFLSACSCYLGLVIGLILGYKTSAVKWIYALAGGMFLYISLVDMLQEATEMSFKEGAGSLKKHLKTFALQNFGMIFGFMIMFVLSIYAKKISV